MVKVEFFRVSYGKPDIPMENREYRLNGQGPVGTIKEICEFFKDPFGSDVTVLLIDRGETYELDPSTGKYSKI